MNGCKAYIAEWDVEILQEQTVSSISAYVTYYYYLPFNFEAQTHNTGHRSML